jgi:mannose-6-phosphate isomerase
MKPFKLINQIQKYPWGSTDYIANLLGKENLNEHWAELWIGDHSRAPSSAVLDSGISPLNEVLLNHSEDILGEDTNRFGKQLPFLFKVLSAESPLSIQAHPDKTKAEYGYRDENQKHIALDAYNRNYKDDNHKPEIICALTPFIAMCGFCKSKIIENNFLKLNSPVFSRYLQDSLLDNKNSIKLFFSSLMNLDSGSLSNLIRTAVLWADNSSSLEASLIKKFSGMYENDPGILAPLFLNVYNLDPGQALYQGPGELHAYVEGTGIELMSNSDNVLRGGLSPKFVDVQELLKVLTFNSSDKKVLEATKNKQGIFEYSTPSYEFILKHLELNRQKDLEINNRKSLEILLCISGTAILKFDSGSISVNKGESILVPASINSIKINGNADIYSAGIPREQNK